VLLQQWRERLGKRRGELAARQLVVLSGGGSAEREVSLLSGRAVRQAIAGLGYQAALATLGADNVSVEELRGSVLPALGAATGLPAGEAVAATSALSTGQPNLIAALRSAPCIVLSTMHGAQGENGAWQGLLELLNVPFVSAGVKGSALGMDKVISKRLFEQLAIPTPRWWIERRTESCRGDIPADVKQLVAKPIAEGSSVGVLMVANDDAGWKQIVELNQRFEPLLIEQRIDGRELTAALIGPSAEALALPLVEIKPGQDFYSYEAKTGGQSNYECPADVNPATTAVIQRHALTIYREFELGPFARIDVLLDSAGRPWFLEANTLPGFTQLSLLPMAARAAGIEMGELLELLLLFALERWEAQQGGPR
jgi:D-alanine-D-alanine ligase